MRIKTFGSALAAAALAAAFQLTASAETGDKAAEVLANTRKALGGKKLEGLKSFTAQAALQRNIGNFQIGSDVELFLELPDKYFRSEAMSRGPVPMSVTTGSGFNGDKSLSRMNAPGLPGGGGGMVIRMGGPGGPMPTNGEKPTPEQEAQIRAMALRAARQEISRLMLGWFGMAHPSINPEYSYAGEAESPDGKAHVIDVKGSDGFEARLFVDQESHLPLMVTYKGPQMRMQTSRQNGGQMTEEDRQRMREELEKLRTQPPQMAEYSIFFGDWREVDGIRFPHQVQRAVAGTTDEEWAISKVKVNAKIDPKKFEAQ